MSAGESLLFFFFPSSVVCRRGRGKHFSLFLSLSSPAKTNRHGPILTDHHNLCPVLDLLRSLTLLVRLLRSLSFLVSFYRPGFSPFAAARLIFQAAFHKIFFVFPLCLMSDISSLQGWFSYWQEEDVPHQVSPSGTSNISTIMRWVFAEPVIGDKAWQFHIRHRCTTQLINEAGTSQSRAFQSLRVRRI